LGSDGIQFAEAKSPQSGDILSLKLFRGVVLRRTLIGVLAIFLLLSAPLTTVQASETPKCNDLGYERLYGTSSGCLMAVSDRATITGGKALNPPFVRCNGDTDSAGPVYLPKVPKSGQLDNLGKVRFEFTYYNECSTWPDAVSFEAYLTDINGKRYPLGTLTNKPDWRDCSIYLDCWPSVYLANEVSGELDTSTLTAEGYYKLSLLVKRDLTIATESEKFLAGTEVNMLMEFSNQLWLGSPKQAPKPEPKIQYCRESKSVTLIATSQSRVTINEAERNKIRSAFRSLPKKCVNGESIQMIECKGTFSSTKSQPKALLRARNACVAAKKLYPKATTFASVRKSSSLNLWVDVTAYYQSSLDR